MAVALEPRETKSPGCLNPMVPAGVTKEEGQPSQHLDCPDSGHHLKEAQGPPWAPSGWAW
jgi:hypothetical protein